MSGKTEKKIAEIVSEKEIVFKCKFCGQTKPFSGLVVMRQYYPQISVCKTCAIGTRKSDQAEEDTQNKITNAGI
jgi:hypothetical protein